MDRALLQQIWPVFSGEAREHLQAIGEGILALEDDPAAAGALERIRRTAHSLKGSAGSLGLGDVERLAHAIEGSLADFDPRDGLTRAAAQAALDAVEAMEEAIAVGDAGGEPGVAALAAHLAALGGGPVASRAAAAPPPDAPPAPPAAAAEPLALVDALEGALEALCAPLPPEGRAAAASGAIAAARRLAPLAGSAAAAVERIAAAFGQVGQGGPEGARAVASLAGELVTLREALERPAAPAAAAPPPAPRADGSVRVLAETLDSLARRLELLAASEARHARRARELRESEGGLHEVARALQAVARRVGPEEKAALTEAAARLRGVSGELARLGRDGAREADGQRLAAAALREDLRALRMVPAGLALEPLRRAVREVAGRLGKEVDLDLRGGDVKLDRRVADALRDPLLHLVRNAVDHGLEAPEARRAAGKPARGRVTVRVEPRGPRVGFVVEDDGAGLDLAAVRGAAVRKGVLDAAAAQRLSDAEAARLVFHPGLSTARALTEISGRGVGLDVVQERLARLQGAVDVSFVPGAGTRFDLDIPLSLAASAAILFRAGRELAALPADAVERVLLLRPGDVNTVTGRPTVGVAGAQLPYATVAALLGADAAPTPGRLRPALVLTSGGQRVVVAVDEVLGQGELVVSSLGAKVARVAHLAGAALLEDGRVVGVLNGPELVRRALPGGGRAAAAPERPRIVVADDALTTRFAMKALLEIAGYAVLPAADGEEAFQLLQSPGARLLVSDVQMPRLDGLGLARRVKGDPRLRGTPIILVTSLDAPEDRAAGLEAGAEGYLVKREVETGKLLDLVRQLLPAGP